MSVIEINDSNFEEKINNGKVVVDCYAVWCGPCKMLSPIIDELANELTNINFYKLNVDDNENIPSKYNIMSIPTILVFENGELKETITGFKPKDELKNIINIKS